ncbi:MAG: hypothetical protein R3Y38_03645 [Rikenellaceae bacterium]
MKKFILSLVVAFAAVTMVSAAPGDVDARVRTVNRQSGGTLSEEQIEKITALITAEAEKGEAATPEEKAARNKALSEKINALFTAEQKAAKAEYAKEVAARKKARAAEASE